jgi:hypothetical protein
MQFISELSAGSQTLQKLNEQFRHVAPKLDIVSFYETRPTPLAVFKKSQIVSARLSSCAAFHTSSRLTRYPHLRWCLRKTPPC